MFLVGDHVAFPQCVIGDFHQRLVTPNTSVGLLIGLVVFHDYPVIPGFFKSFPSIRRIIDPDIWKASHQGVE